MSAEDTRTLWKIAAVVAVSLVGWVWVYLWAMKEAGPDEELETLKAAPRWNEEDFDVAFSAMDEDERLAVQRRAEAQSWIDYDEDFRRESA